MISSRKTVFVFPLSPWAGRATSESSFMSEIKLGFVALFLRFIFLDDFKENFPPDAKALLDVKSRLQKLSRAYATDFGKSPSPSVAIH